METNFWLARKVFKKIIIIKEKIIKQNFPFDLDPGVGIFLFSMILIPIVTLYIMI